jgi:flagellar protein FlgJ
MLAADGISPAATPPLPPAAPPGGTLKGAGGAKLREAAKEMEATFLGLLLKQMRETLDPEGGLFPGDSGDVQGGLFDLYMSRHLADAGGVGMAGALLRQVSPAAPNQPTTDAPKPSLRGYAPSAPRA